MVVCLRPGILVYREPDSKRHFIAVDGGFAEVQKDRVHVLADGAARSEEIDRTEEERSLETARRALRGEISGMSLEDATFELERAASRLRAARMSTFVGEEIFSG
jgi:F0F1-type ATP synthase epsilon subunit